MCNAVQQQHAAKIVLACCGARRDEDAVVASIQARIADWTHLPPENAEPLQALRYENGQEYKAHWDVFIDPKHTNGTHQNRLATVVMYLSDVIEGEC